jgi:mRNA interferase MazF
MEMVKRFDVYMCSAKSMHRPCVVLSPDEMNDVLPYAVIAPITKAERFFPTRAGIRLKGQQGQVALDFIRTVPRANLKEKIGTLPENTRTDIIEILNKMFSR